MSLGTKLQQLRKQKGLSQEALAQELNVSRQAVSKWETDEGYPEMDKLILLGDLFEVSMDYLLKDHPTQQIEPSSQKYFMNKQKIEDYMKFKRNFSLRIALGVSAIIFSLNIPLILENTPYEPLAGALFLIVVAFSVMTFVLNGLLSKNDFELETKEIYLSYNDLQDLQNQYTTFKSRFGFSIAFGIFAIILSIAGVVIFEEYFHYKNVGSMIFLTTVAIAVFIFITQGVKDSMYQFLVHNKEFLEEQHREKENDKLFAWTMPLAAMIYVFLGLTKNWWHPGWIIFPIAVFLTMAISYFHNTKS